MTVGLLTSTLGWCAVINIGILLFATLMLLLGGRLPRRLHRELFGLDEVKLNEAYFQFLANYKLLILLFNVTPYFALQLATAITTN